jgi:hypothetical protein
MYGRNILKGFSGRVRSAARKGRCTIMVRIVFGGIWTVASFARFCMPGRHG